MANYKGMSSGHGLHQQQQQQISFAAIPPPSSSSSMHGSFVRSSKEGSSGVCYDLGELDQALFMYLDGQDNSSSAQEQLQTLNIFPSQPMHVEPSTKGGISLAFPSSSGSKKSSEQAVDMEKESKAAVIKKEGSRKGKSGVDPEGHNTRDPKTLRRLAQNREAARKSRIRKKAYIQQLENSRIKLAQLEQELQRSRMQGVLFGGGALLGDQGLPAGVGVFGSEAAISFDMKYARWVEEHQQLMCELREAAQELPSEKKLREFVDCCLAHYDQMMHLKDTLARSDIFHLTSGVWLTPAERCFMWMGGFRPSNVIKVVLSEIEPLTEQQVLGVYGLQQSTQETEEALTQGLEALNQSLSESITSETAIYMAQMASAINKLDTLEGLIRQADNLRLQMLHLLYQTLTTRQMARCLLAIAEYFRRLRALSSLWVARPRQAQ